MGRGGVLFCVPLLTAGLIGEVDSLQLNVPPKGRRRYRVWQVADGRLAIQQFPNALDTGIDFADGVPLFDDLARGLEHIADLVNEEHQRADRDGRRLDTVDQPQAQPHHPRDGQGFQHFHHPAKAGL